MDFYGFLDESEDEPKDEPKTVVPVTVSFKFLKSVSDIIKSNFSKFFK